MKLTSKRTVVQPILLMLVLFLAWGIQRHYVLLRFGEVKNSVPECPWCEDERHAEDVVFLPVKASMLRLLAPADPNFIADLLWLRTAYYFGKHALTDREYPYLLHMLDLITDLSPAWEWPFFFGAAIFATEVQARDEGIYLIEKGLQKHRSDWQLWFYKGYYLWKFADDVLGAADALNEAALLPGAPPFLKALSATLATRAGQHELAVRFLEDALRRTSDPIQQEVLMQKLEEIRSDEATGR